MSPILTILILFTALIGFVEVFFMVLVDWEDLPVATRRSPRKLYNVIKEAINGLENEDDEEEQLSLEEQEPK